MSRVCCLLDGNRGIYIPRDFAKDFRVGEGYWENINPEDLAICAKGPDEEAYWEAWQNILDNATYLTSKVTKVNGVSYPKGKLFRLEQDGDLFMVDDAEEES